ncbi:MAG: hypothetical protein ABI389_14400 [Rhodanobacter sp.]
MRKNLIHLMPALLFACAMPLAAQAAEGSAAASKQVATATAHAGMALGATDVNMVHTHLHHVINCLVGPSGADFDGSAGNPCKDMGHGAIADAKGDVAVEGKLHAAVHEAKQGLQATKLEGAHVDAQKVLSTLQKAK